MRNGKSYSEAGKLGYLVSRETIERNSSICKCYGKVLDYKHRN